MADIKERIKKGLKDNGGFSLTELIIVIAIILVMTAASFVTLTIMHSARAKEAASSFENAIAEVINLSKNNGVDKDANGSIDSAEEKYTIGLRIYKDGRKYYLQKHLRLLSLYLLLIQPLSACRPPCVHRKPHL